MPSGLLSALSLAGSLSSALDTEVHVFVLISLKIDG